MVCFVLTALLLATISWVGQRGTTVVVGGLFVVGVALLLLALVLQFLEAAERRYSPAVCTGAVQQRITGNPDARHISTSFVERQNLTMRMSMRRRTRLTNAFSKKLDNHKAAVALYFMWYNFAPIHQTLKRRPSRG